MGMEGNGNELSGAIREWEWFFKCVNFGNGNGKDVAGMGGIGNTENHSRTSLNQSDVSTAAFQDSKGPSDLSRRGMYQGC